MKKSTEADVLGRIPPKFWRPTERILATLTLRGLGRADKEIRRDVAEWLRMEARLIEGPLHRALSYPHTSEFSVSR